MFYVQPLYTTPDHANNFNQIFKTCPDSEMVLKIPVKVP